VRDRIAAVVIHSLALLLLVTLVFVIGFALWRGRDALAHANLFTRDLSDAGPRDPLTAGGILHAIAGTLEQITIALVITVPLGLTCAVFLTETRGAFTRFVRTIAEAMTALPSIVAGLFIYATIVLILGFEKSGFAAALALSVMMLPIVIRAADVVIRLVPRSLKEASYALGAGQWRTVWHVVLPTTRSGLATAVILGTARGIGETSPVLITAGYTAALNTNPFSGPQVSLPLAAFQLVKSPSPAMIARGFGAAATLLAMVLVLFAVARIIGGRGPGSTTARQQRRRARASARDATRYEARDTARYEARDTTRESGGRHTASGHDAIFRE
jgi:phosphate transport system permease protein